MRINKVTYVLEEDLEDTTGLLVDEARDTLDTATTSETTDSLQHATIVRNKPGRRAKHDYSRA